MATNKRGVYLTYWDEGVTIQQIKDAGYDYAILRGGLTGIGYGSPKSTDGRFADFYDQASALKFPVGVAYVSLATTREKGEAEAAFLYENIIQGRVFQCPVVYAVRKYLDEEGVAEAVKGFTDYLSAKGYTVAVWDRTYTGTVNTGGYMVNTVEGFHPIRAKKPTARKGKK